MDLFSAELQKPLNLRPIKIHVDSPLQAVCFITSKNTLLNANIHIEIFLIVDQPCHDGPVVKALD